MKELWTCSKSLLISCVTFLAVSVPGFAQHQENNATILLVGSDFDKDIYAVLDKSDPNATPSASANCREEMRAYLRNGPARVSTAEANLNDGNSYYAQNGLHIFPYCRSWAITHLARELALSGQMASVELLHRSEMKRFDTVIENADKADLLYLKRLYEERYDAASQYLKARALQSAVFTDLINEKVTAAPDKVSQTIFQIVARNYLRSAGAPEATALGDYITRIQKSAHTRFQTVPEKLQKQMFTEWYGSNLYFLSTDPNPNFGDLEEAFPGYRTELIPYRRGALLAELSILKRDYNYSSAQNQEDCAAGDCAETWASLTESYKSRIDAIQVELATFNDVTAEAEKPKGIPLSKEASHAKAAHMAKIAWIWADNMGVKLVSENLPFATANTYSLKTYIGNEDGVSTPIRTGREVALYNRLKEFEQRRPAGGSLNMADLFKLGLETAEVRGNSVNINEVCLSVHNVVRILARPEQWALDPRRADYGSRMNDPALPIFLDALGQENSGPGSTLADLKSQRRSEERPGELVNIQYTVGLFDKDGGIFQYQDNAPTGHWNAGAHYYFWVGALANYMDGGTGAATAIGSYKEQSAKDATNEHERGIFQISHFRSGADAHHMLTRQISKRLTVEALESIGSVP